MCVCVCVCVCVSLSLSLCLCLYMYLHIYVTCISHTHTHIYTHAYTYDTYIYIYIRTQSKYVSRHRELSSAFFSTSAAVLAPIRLRPPFSNCQWRHIPDILAAIPDAPSPLPTGSLYVEHHHLDDRPTVRMLTAFFGPCLVVFRVS